jgi:LysR family transcriptional regulator, cell division regulator
LEGAFVCGPVRHADLVEEPVFAEELVVVTARSVTNLDKYFKSGNLKIVVLRAGCSYRQRLEDILAKRGIVGVRILEFGTIDGVLSCAAVGIGASLLPRAIVGRASRQGKVAIHKLPASQAHVKTMFIRRRDGYASSALAAFLACAHRGAPVAEAAAAAYLPI